MRVRPNSPVLRYTPLGAAREVTGSCHLIEFGRTKILFDVGMHQGFDNVDRDYRIPPNVDLSKVDFVVLSHAHLDHSGRLPYFGKNGLKARIVCTHPTKPLAELIMRDSAKIMDEDSKRKSGKPPLYTGADVDGVMGLFDTYSYGEKIDLADNISITFYDAGHILGSAYVNFEFNTGHHKSNMVFSGDLGKSGKSLITDPVFPNGLTPENVVIESTYGNRLHKSFDNSVQEFYDAINEGFARGGNIYIPTLAVERAQELMYLIREGVQSGRVTSTPKVVLDSPMAIGATKIFRNHMDLFNPEARALYAGGEDLFSVEFSDTRETSEQLNDVHSGSIILAGSGMCNGGRIIHHLKNCLSNPKHTVIFTSYAPEGTLARRIVDLIPELEKIEGKRKSNSVNIFGDEVPVRAKLYTINGFSGHADKDMLTQWLSPLAGSGHLKRLFIVHGHYEDSMIPFAGHLVGQGYNTSRIKIQMPEYAKPLVLLK